MIISFIITIGFIILVLTNYDFNLIINKIPLFKDFNIGSVELNILIVTVGFLILSAIEYAYDLFLFSPEKGFNAFDGRADFIKFNKKRLKTIKFYMIGKTVLYLFILYLVFSHYLVQIINAILDEASLEEEIGKIFVFALYGAITLVGTGFMTYWLSIFIRQTISALKGTYRIAIDYCNNCQMGAVDIKVVYKKRKDVDTVLDSVHGGPSVSSELIYNENFKTIEVDTKVTHNYFKQETVTTDSYTHQICRCCGKERIGKSTTKETKKYYLTERGNWRELRG